MALFLEQFHAENPPETWEVRKTGRRWGLFAARAEHPLESFDTKRAALEARSSGWLVKLYDQERRWYAGEHVEGWKDYRPGFSSLTR